MSDEVKTPEEKPTENKAEAPKAPEQKAPEQKAPEQKAPPAEQPKTDSKRSKKINLMTLPELEKKLEEVKVKMGGLSSGYAQQLLKRKEQLAGGKHGK